MRREFNTVHGSSYYVDQRALTKNQPRERLKPWSLTASVANTDLAIANAPRIVCEQIGSKMVMQTSVATPVLAMTERQTMLQYRLTSSDKSQSLE